MCNTDLTKRTERRYARGVAAHHLVAKALRDVDELDGALRTGSSQHRYLGGLKIKRWAASGHFEEGYIACGRRAECLCGESRAHEMAPWCGGIPGHGRAGSGLVSWRDTHMRGGVWGTGWLSPGKTDHDRQLNTSWGCVYFNTTWA